MCKCVWFMWMGSLHLLPRFRYVSPFVSFLFILLFPYCFAEKHKDFYQKRRAYQEAETKEEVKQKSTESEKMWLQKKIDSGNNNNNLTRWPLTKTRTKQQFVTKSGTDDNDNTLTAKHLIYKNETEKKAISHRLISSMELKVWVEGIQRIVCGVTETTTCQVN